jgi:phosphoserine phosphatase RsbU/P
MSERMERIEQELHEAERMQRSILPSEDPVFGGLDISSYFQPATEVGGDYYDYIELTKSTLAIAIGDVKGHGMQAGLLVSAASGCLNTSLETNRCIEEVMQVVNRRVCEVKGNTLMTFSLSVLDAKESQVTISSAGHPLPYHYCAETGSLMSWAFPGSLPLGMLHDSEYQVFSRSLGEGDALAYYSDGLVEGTDASGEFFGFERLEAYICQHSHLDADGIKQGILTDFLMHCQGHEQEDDVTLIVVKISGLSE